MTGSSDVKYEFGSVVTSVENAFFVNDFWLAESPICYVS